MIDFSKALAVTHVFTNDAFKPGRAYRIRMHDIDKMIKCVINATDYDDDNAVASYNLLMEKLFRQFDTVGFDAICTSINPDKVTFTTSYVGVVTDGFHIMYISIPIDMFKEFIDSDKTLMKSDIEIFETKAIVPEVDFGFKPAEKPNTTTEGLTTDKSPKKKKRSWIERLAASQHGDDSTATGDNR